MKKQLMRPRRNIVVGKPAIANKPPTPALSTFFVAVALLLAAPSVQSVRAEVSRDCRWNASSVPVYIDLTSFELRGWGRQHIVQEVINATTVWNTEAGGNLSLNYAGDRTVSPVRNENLGKITIFAAESAGDSYAITAWSRGDCAFGSIAIYDRIDETSPPANGIEWSLDAPEARTFSMANVLVHELGHAIGGYSDDYSNPNTVMQSAGSGVAPSLHLYSADIRLFQDGDPAAGIMGYGRRHHAARYMHSIDAVNWIDDGTEIGWSYLRPAAAAGPTSKVVAYVETLNTANTVQTRRFSAPGGWEQPVTHVKSYTGVALANFQGSYVLAYTEESDSRRIWVKTSDDGRTWTMAVLLHETARTQGDPALFVNAAVNRIMAFWTDRDTDRLMYSSSSTGRAWEIPREIDQNPAEDPREYYSYRGPTGSCNDNNQCLLVWPSWTTYGLANLGMCTLQMSFDANTLAWNLLNLRCPNDGTGRTPGVAFGRTPGFSGWVLGFAGRDANNALAVLRKSQHTTAEAWTDKSVLRWKNADGVTMIHNSAANRWEVYLVSR